ncbi:MAG: ATP-binding cassette domain-containing protein [Flavobacteriaceae bacterium]|jgi:ATPase subunit of ABC transporter with duplicated ATPase domains|nr:ATP-binding cassette domain-containing protein [Flavobacteriaceae bacterium]
MLIIQDITYIHPNKDLLFNKINLTVNKHDKIALIGNNGAGKSTLLKIIAGILSPSGGILHCDSRIYYVPQIFGQFNEFTVAQAIGIDEKLKALSEIVSGNVTETNLTVLNDDWSIEERCNEALSRWKLEDLNLDQQMKTLSGGQKTKVFLAGMSIHQPEMILLDEPSNHLDINGRALLYDFIQSYKNSMIVVSHDRKLLNLLDSVCELSSKGITVYGGNYDFYAEQKQIEKNALNEDIKSKEKALRKAKETERETSERQQRQNARGNRQQRKEGTPKAMINKLKNDAERSSARLKGVHAEKTEAVSRELTELRKELPYMDGMKFGFDNSTFHLGKTLIIAENINFGYDGRLLWRQPLSFRIKHGERIVLHGANGSGKTTLIKIILDKLQPTTGTIHRAGNSAVYIDQDYSLIDNRLTVYAQSQIFNTSAMPEHEIKIRLNRFLFTKNDWDKSCNSLSGGEKMRLMLCCLTISNHAPDIIVLDEPTNNLDIRNIEILTAAINEYRGTLIVVSHDSYFLEQINAESFFTID